MLIRHACYWSLTLNVTCSNEYHLAILTAIILPHKHAVGLLFKGGIIIIIPIQRNSIGIINQLTIMVYVYLLSGRVSATADGHCRHPAGMHSGMHT